MKSTNRSVALGEEDFRCGNRSARQAKMSRPIALLAHVESWNGIARLPCGASEAVRDTAQQRPRDGDEWKTWRKAWHNAGRLRLAVWLHHVVDSVGALLPF